MEHLSSTESVVRAVRETLATYGRECRVSHDIGADQTSRRTTADIGATTDPDGSLPHEAYVEVPGSPELELQIFADGDARIRVENVDFHDLPWADVPAFLTSLHTGVAHVKGRFFPSGWWLLVPLPGDRTYKELVPGIQLTPWLSRHVR